jgi:hypothetical protein
VPVLITPVNGRLTRSGHQKGCSPGSVAIDANRKVVPVEISAAAIEIIQPAEVVSPTSTNVSIGDVIPD